MKAKDADKPIFYVYEHWRMDKGVCFYVGKGKGNRAWKVKTQRNRHHAAIVKKLEKTGYIVDVRIVKSDMFEADALELEKQLIAFHGFDHLTNKTNGGDGLTSPTEETRKKMSASQLKRFRECPEELEKMSLARKGRKTSEETKKKLSLLNRGRKMPAEARAKMKEAAKLRGISQSTREAQRLAVTGKKRSPFTEETKKKMSEAAKVREAKKKLARNMEAN
jgi:hypothetical protein